MSHEKPFYLREPWRFDAKHRSLPRMDAVQGFETRALHAGYRPGEALEKLRSFVPPIVSSMTYPYERFDKVPYPVYGRTKTPTEAILEERLASLEGGEAALTASSGAQALFHLLFTLARPGDNMVTSLHIFGEGYKQAAHIFPERCQVQCRFVRDPANLEEWARNIDDRTRLVWIETPSNPCLFVTDIAGVAEVAHARNVPLLVDNTAATAALQRPMDLGADLVLLSLTKFLSGNATILGGAVVGPTDLIEDIRWNTTEFVGAVMTPMDSWLALQYLETLSLRMERHSENALRVAQFLERHPAVQRVNYPGLEAHPQRPLVQRQMNAGGGLLSFVVPEGIAGAARVMDRFRLITHAVTFGTSRTICMHPRTITHEHLTQAERDAAGIAGGLIRLSVGLEKVEDLLKDLEQALASVHLS